MEAAESNLRYSLDTEYMEEARKYTGKDTPDTVTKKLQALVERAARKAGYNSPKLYHGTQAFGFTRFDLSKGNGLIFASSNLDTSLTYSGETTRSTVSYTHLSSKKKEKALDALHQHFSETLGNVL